jgi:excisionase family DNA binding protein
MELVFKVDGRTVELDELAEALLARAVKVQRSEIKAMREPEMPARVSIAEKGPGEQPRAVGIVRAAELLSLSKHTIRKYVANGRLHSVRAGRRILIPMATLERFLREGFLP